LKGEEKAGLKKDFSTYLFFQCKQAFCFGVFFGNIKSTSKSALVIEIINSEDIGIMRVKV